MDFDFFFHNKGGPQAHIQGTDEGSGGGGGGYRDDGRGRQLSARLSARS